MLFSAELPWCCFLCRSESSPNELKFFDDFFGTKKALETTWEGQKSHEEGTTHQGTPWCLMPYSFLF
jgi:hypothetical protein